MEAGGGWCSIAIMVPSLNTAPIVATGSLHGPLKFVALAQELLCFTCELIRGCVGVSLRAGLRRSAVRSRLVAVGFLQHLQTLLSMCIPRLLTECLLQ